MPEPNSPPPPPPRWRLRYGDQVFGPFDREELEQLLAEGRLDRASLLAGEGQSEDWRPAGEIPELAGLFAKASLPAKAKPPRVPAAVSADNTMLHVVYALYAAQLVTGITALIGLVIAYVKRGEVAGSWRASHFEWLIRTFWWGLLFVFIGFVTTPFGAGVLIGLLTGAWFVWRIVKGWLRLGQLRGLEDPTSLL